MLEMEDSNTINMVFNGISFEPLMKLERKEKEVRFQPCFYCSVEMAVAWNRLLMIKKEEHPDAKHYKDIQLTPVKKEEDDPSSKNCVLVEESVDNLMTRKHQNPDEIIK